MAWLSNNGFSPSDSLHADDLNNLANDVRTWGGNVNGGGYHLSNVVIDNYFPGSGQATISPIHIIPTSTDLSSQLRLDSEAAGNPARWILIKDATPETGSNAGSNFALERCDDTGNVLSTPIAINRASGIMTLGQQQWAGNVDGGGFTLSNVIIPSVFADPLTTKGDMVVRGATTTRLPVGPDGTVIQADSTQPLGVKWSTSPAVPVSTQIIAGAGMSGGGALTGNVTLNALVTSVFGRTGAVVLTSADVSGASGVLNTRQVIAGAGMSGGGPLTTDITLNALVTSVFGRTGAVVLTAADLTGVGVPATRKLIAGSGMSIAGNANSDLSTDLTLTAAVTSVQGHTGAVTLSQSDLGAAGAVLVTQGVLNTDGTLSGGGAFGPTTGANGGNLTLGVVPNSSVQKINFYSNNSSSPVGTSSGLNLIPGTNMTIQMVPNATTHNMDVQLISNGVMAIWTTNSNVNSGAPLFVAGQPAVNFIAGSNVTISGTNNSGSSRVDLTISAVGGTGGGGSQSPWTGPIYGSGYPLNGASFIGVNASSDSNNSVNPARLAVAVGASNETGVRVGLTGTGATTLSSTVQVQNDNGTSRAALISYGSLYGGTLEGTAGLRASVGPMTFAMGSPETEAMRISSPGNRVLIGTTADDGIEILQVAGKIKTIGTPTTSGIVFGDGTVQTTAAVTATAGVPVGPVGAIQTNAGAGAFGGDATFIYNATTNVHTLSSAVNNPTFQINATGGYVPDLFMLADGGASSTLKGSAYSGSSAIQGGLYLIGVSARGSQASPAPCQAADFLFRLVANGYNGSGFIPGANIFAQSQETWDGTHDRTDLIFSTASGGAGAAERMRITGTGLVGIGTVAPNKALDCRASLQVANTDFAVGGAGSALWLDMGATSGNTYSRVQALTTGSALPGILSLNPLGGDVGIGTAIPRGALEVSTNTVTDTFRGLVSSQYYTGPHSAVLWLVKGRGTLASPAPVAVGDSIGNIQFMTVTSDLSVQTAGWISMQVMGVGTGTISGDMAFATANAAANPAEKMRITAAGNVGIGTSSPAAILTLQRAGSDVSLQWNNGSIFRSWYIPNGTTDFRLFNSSTSSDVMIVSAGGNVGIGNTAPPVKLFVSGLGDAGPNLSTYTGIVNIYNSQTGITTEFGALTNSPYTSYIQSVQLTGSYYALSLQPAGGNVGIGTLSPTAKLDVWGGQSLVSNDANIVGSGGSPAYSQLVLTGQTATTKSLWLGFDTGANVGVIQAGVSGASWNNLLLNPDGGNIGIGTATPSCALDVAQTIRAMGVAAPSTGVGIEIGYAATPYGFVQAYDRSGAAYKPLHFDGLPMALNVNSGGNVGVGAVGPTYQLHVRGVGQTPSSYFWPGTAGGTLYVEDTGGAAGNGGAICFGAGGLGPFAAIRGYLTNGNGPMGTLSFYIRPTTTDSALYNRMILDGSGNLNITGQYQVNGVPISGGASYPGVSSPSSGKLAYTAGSSVATLGISASAGDTITGSAAGDVILNSSGGTNGWLFGNGGGVVAQLSASGKWALGYTSVVVPGYLLTLAADSTQKPTTNTWNTGSDIRLKRNVRPFTEGLETILKINPIRFEYNGRMRYPKGTQCVGVDAGAHKDILPDCVSTFRAQLDDDGPDEDVYSFNPHAITFMFINAIKELTDRLERLEKSLIH